MEIRENDFVLCTVKKIEGTSVFLQIEECQLMGSMVLSEVAAGRIRNLGDYVSKGKKVVCKVLKISNDHVELSLRRVTGKEREDVLEWHQKALAFRRILESSVKNAIEVIKKIEEDYDLVDFIEEGKKDKKIFGKYLDEDEAAKILQMIKDNTEKEKVVKKRFMLRSFSDSGASEIKKILSLEEGKIYYQGSSVFSISVSAKDFKEAENRLTKVLDEIGKRAKERKVIFEVLRER